MAAANRPADADDGPVAAFAVKLNDLYARSGRTSLRHLAGTANYSHTTISRALAGKGLPTWDVVAAFVHACGDDPAAWRSSWEATRRAAARRATPATALIPDPYGIVSADGLARQLKALKTYLGGPSYRTIGRRAGLPASTVADVFNARDRVPGLHLLTRILTALGVDAPTMEVWVRAWKGVATRPARADEVHPLLRQAGQLGLDAIFPTRIQALRSFIGPLEREIEKGTRGRLWIVGSSVKGLVQVVDEFDGMSIIARALDRGCDVRLLCTDPRRGDLRAAQEHRPLGAIHQEIRLSLINLRLVNLGRENVKYHRHSSNPTVFGICVSDTMILNPYPYGSEAFKNFTIVVRQTGNDDTGIFERYLDRHFERSWQEGHDLTDEEWDEYKLPEHTVVDEGAGYGIPARQP